MALSAAKHNRFSVLRELALDHFSNRLRVGVGRFLSFGFDHNAHQGLSSTRANEHATGIAHFSFSCMHGIPNGSVPLERMFIFHAHVNQRLRELRHNLDSFFDRLAAATNGSEELARRHQAIARGIVLEQNHMARLLAANGIAAFAHRLEHIAVAHLGLQHVNAMSLHSAHEAQIGHNGGDRRVMGQLAAILQIDRKHRLDDVAIDFGAIFCHEHHAVGVAIVGNAHVSAAFGHKLGHSFVLGRAVAQPGLLEQVVRFKEKFYRTPWAKLADARPGTLRLAPPKGRLDELAADYASMRPMLFGSYPSIDEIVAYMAELEETINGLN